MEGQVFPFRSIDVEYTSTVNWDPVPLAPIGLDHDGSRRFTEKIHRNLSPAGQLVAGRLIQNEKPASGNNPHRTVELNFLDLRSHVAYSFDELLVASLKQSISVLVV